MKDLAPVLLAMMTHNWYETTFLRNLFLAIVDRNPEMMNGFTPEIIEIARTDAENTIDLKMKELKQEFIVDSKKVNPDLINGNISVKF